MRNRQEMDEFSQADSYDAVVVAPQEGMSQLAAHLDRGWEYLARGDLAAAERSAQRALDVDSMSPEAHTLKGAVVWTEGRVEEALESFEQALELDPDNPEPMLYSAEVLARDSDRTVEARNLAEDAVELAEARGLFGIKAQGIVLLAELALSIDDEAHASALLTLNHDFLKENESMLERAGVLYHRLGNAEWAEDFLTAALQTSHTGDAHYFLGHIYLETGRVDLVTDQFLGVRYHDVTAGPPAWTYGEDAFDMLCHDKAVAAAKDLDLVLDERRILVVDYPGVEAIMQGVDPRAPVYVGREPEPSSAWFAVVYQLNVERACSLAEEVPEVLETALSTQFKDAVGG